jgi:hypothetical protein
MHVKKRKNTGEESKDDHRGWERGERRAVAKLAIGLRVFE